MNTLLRTYAKLNLLSIDVALGAMACAMFLCRVASVPIQWSSHILLALTVWIIYTVDHLRDAKRINSRASSERHRFHQQYFSWLVASVLVAMLIGFVLLFWVPQHILNAGIVLALIVVFYIMIQHRLGLLKELVIALFYTAGVLLPSLMSSFKFTVPPLVISAFMLTALLNLLVFSWYDEEDDKRDRQTSVAVSVGAPMIRKVIYAIGMINLVIAMLLPFHHGKLVLLSMNVVFLLIISVPSYFSKSNRYRIVGDAVFFLPLLQLL